MRSAFILVTAILLITGIGSAAIRGLADAHYYAARATLEHGSRAHRTLDATELAHVEAALSRARRLEPSNPLFVEQSGRVAEMRARLPGTRGRAALRVALAHFRNAAGMRPGSPYAWVDIALVKYALDDMDHEFYGALERAARLGPWEPAILLALADIGFGAWRVLAEPGRRIVLEAIARALPGQEQALRRIAGVHSGRVGPCASAAARGAELASLCRKN